MRASSDGPGRRSLQASTPPSTARITTAKIATGREIFMSWVRAGPESALE